MPKNDKGPAGEGETFASFIQRCSSKDAAGGSGSVTLIGMVTPGGKEGHFVLSTGGQTFELPVDAVESHRVLQSAEAQHLLELKFKADKAPQFKPITDKLLLKEGHHDKNPILEKIPWIDRTFKEMIKDPIFEQTTGIADQWGPWGQGGQGDPFGGLQGPMAGGATPFVLATSHQAPASAVAAQGLIPPLHTIPNFDSPHTIKESIKDPIFDTPAWHDRLHTFKEMAKDPIFDPIKQINEGGGTWAEGGGLGTLAEGGGGFGIGGGWPGYA